MGKVGGGGRWGREGLSLERLERKGKGKGKEKGKGEREREREGKGKGSFGLKVESEG